MERYRRNYQTITPTQQLILQSKRVAVIGCGGLGGFVIEGLVRLGVNQLVLVDSDRFEKSNLNRQLFSSESTLGQFKVNVASERVMAIDGRASVQSYQERLTSENIDFIIGKCDCIIDCTDNVQTKRLLVDYALKHKIPLVYGAVAGLYGQVAVIHQPIGNLDSMFSKETGLEAQLGNPYFIVGMIGSLQVYLACQLLAGVEQPLGMYMVDLKSMDIDFVAWE